MSKVLNLSSESEVTSDEKRYSYNGKTVKIITVFNDKHGSTALIEYDDGEITEVPKDAIM